MKKYFLLGLMTLIVVLLSGCMKEEEVVVPKPEDTMAAYIDHWEQGQYGEMYALLSGQSQAAITKDEFVKRHTSIYEGIGMQNLKVELDLPEEEILAEGAGQTRPVKTQQVETSTSYPYQMSMDTSAGPVEAKGKLEAVKNTETNEWMINWSPALLFPSMKEGDRVTVRTLKAQRGGLYDRFGQGLAVNDSMKVLGVVPGELGEDRDKAIATLAKRLGMTEEQIRGKLGASWVKDNLFVPIANLTGERAKTSYSDLSGVSIREESVRTYPYGEAAAHLTGYIREVTAEDLEKKADKNLAPGDVIGKAGMELVYEDRLRGQDGLRISILAADGSTREVLTEAAPVHGEDIYVTVDADLQTAIYEAYAGDSGTGAAIQPRTGEVLALVSSPSYDPNAFIRGLSSEQWKDWTNDPEKPLLNRFTSLYAPGSVFKPITAAIGLQLGVTTLDEEKRIEGLRWTKDESWGSYYVKRVRNAPVEKLADAMVNSDNIFLAQEAVEMGADNFSREAEKFGFGQPLPVAYPFPKASLSNKGITSEILLADSSYGQGEVQMTSLHLALSYTPFMNDGKLIKPVFELHDRVSDVTGEAWGDPLMNPETALAVHNMLLQVVENPSGTGHGALKQGRKTAGKTGTAELKRSKDEKGQENGWFVVYDADNAELLLSLMVENVQERGGSKYVVQKAAPVLHNYLDQLRFD
ncbi:penicillin-binding transpeptidase domain-containing protein [Paenibacillus sambharensis]|uniref:Penicillin-binding transpeptidase domain-containing protein n=1 Tax=Paenibacillus sambharensis TaxID=1803190 RepID=A0A2W1LKI3_9BACL|nr:penicillin-binding transpeptidase domain-containing protein [Paenibacillus sambharensis]PZD95024.1 penicillin-binding transpeptidase domain-containing protein [Paenibacillus sambharensis]